MVGKGTITMRETRILEFKETITNTFLKTVSAFSNYNGGTILFGVDDNGNVKGLPDVKQACLDIENKINDSILPQPNYALEIQHNAQRQAAQLDDDALESPLIPGGAVDHHHAEEGRHGTQGQQ